MWGILMGEQGTQGRKYLFRMPPHMDLFCFEVQKYLALF